jgi:DNA-directed RNA polymerase specialized sigma subunit
MFELKELISKAKRKDFKAMEELFKKYKPLLKSNSKKYCRYGMEYDDVFQQASIIFIIAVYDFEGIKDIPFSGYIKKKINWGLYHYYRRYMQRKMEVPSGLDPISHHR